jgi:ATP-binding cassette subfamily B protein
MIAGYYGRMVSLQLLRERAHITRDGVSMIGIIDAAESIGLSSFGTKLTYDQLALEVTMPCIVHWKKNHFIIVYKILKSKVFIADPAIGMICYSVDVFKQLWISSIVEGQDFGLALLLKPTPDFYKDDFDLRSRASIRFLIDYFKPYKKYLVSLIANLVVGSAILLILPFLTQAVVDIGINNHNLQFIDLILIAQLVLVAGKTGIEFIRSWILLHIGSRINISLVSDYLNKMMKLPTSFFETKTTGDILQRVSDHSRIESFMTQSSFSLVFSAFNLLAFGIVLAAYNLKILFVFILGSILYVGWIQLFLKKRGELDNRRFIELSDNQNSLIQLIAGIQEIKINTCEKQKRWNWESIQARIFKTRVKSLSLVQNQQVGSMLINETKNILITFLAAKSVLNGGITLGEMFAIQFIIGQMNGPIEQIISFSHSMQDARISLERLAEVHNQPDEANVTQDLSFDLPPTKNLSISNLVYQYEGPHSRKVVNGISFEIPENKVTAIVGSSGSGKTTLIKLLLGLYKPVSGEICIGGINLESIDQRVFRSSCGAVLQDGYLFSDSLARNIALEDDEIDIGKLAESARIANMHDFVHTNPLGFNAIIGANGHGLSQGQKQRILIARAVYKNPRFLFFDEATNSLDTNNEKVILENLTEFFNGRTVIIVAHRLSTVRNADQILVMEQGMITETGNHDSLVKLKGVYFHLIKNQLELGL